MIRLYGIDRGNGSWSRVTHGLRRGLEHHGQLAGFYRLSDADLSYGDDRFGDGYDAPVGLCVGPPTAASALVGQGRHEHRLLMIATNSSWLPEVVMEQTTKHVTGYVGTSAWASSVVEHYAADLPVYTWPHGVDSGFVPHKTPPDGEFSVLHLASTHLQRKSTEQLIHGWAEAIRGGQLPAKAKLRLVINGPRGYYLETVHAASGGCIEIADSFTFYPRLDLSVEDLSVMYSRHHFVCQPSRAEGFGLVPVEARACGVPVIVTACTGHAEHVLQGLSGLVIVPHGADELVNDGPGALAPSVAAADIQAALALAYAQRADMGQQARDTATSVREQWSWEAVTAKFLQRYTAALDMA